MTMYSERFPKKVRVFLIFRNVNCAKVDGFDFHLCRSAKVFYLPPPYILSYLVPANASRLSGFATAQCAEAMAGSAGIYDGFFPGQPQMGKSIFQRLGG